MRKLLLIFTILASGVLFSQSTIDEYYTLIRQAEKCIVDQDFDCANQKFIAAMDINEKPFFIDVFNAFRCNLRTYPDTTYLRKLSNVFNLQCSNGKDLVQFVDFANQESDFNYKNVLNESIWERLRINNFEITELSKQFKKEIRELKIDIEEKKPGWFSDKNNQLKSLEFFNRIEKILLNPDFHEFELGFDGTQRLKEILDIVSESKLNFELRIQGLIMDLIKSGKLNNRTFVFYIDDLFKDFDKELTFLQRPVIKMRDVKYYRNYPPNIISIVDENRKKIYLNTYEELLQQYRFSDLHKETFFPIQVTESHSSHNEAYEYLLESINKGKYLRLFN